MPDCAPSRQPQTGALTLKAALAHTPCAPLGMKALEESHRIRRRPEAMAGQATAGTPSILPKPFCSNTLRNLIHSNRRFKVYASPSPTQHSSFNEPACRPHSQTSGGLEAARGPGGPGGGSAGRRASARLRAPIRGRRGHGTGEGVDLRGASRMGDAALERPTGAYSGLLGAAFKLFSPKIVVARLVAVSFGALITLSIWGIVSELSDKWSGVWAAVSFLLSPRVLILLVSTMLEVPAFALALAAFLGGPWPRACSEAKPLCWPGRRCCTDAP